AVAHLAGALGKPVWLLSRYDCCWRWLLDRADSPWYPTMRIFRQPSPGDWKSVMAEVTRELEELTRKRAMEIPPEEQTCQEQTCRQESAQQDRAYRPTVE